MSYISVFSILHLATGVSKKLLISFSQYKLFHFHWKSREFPFCLIRFSVYREKKKYKKAPIYFPQRKVSFHWIFLIFIRVAKDKRCLQYTLFLSIFQAYLCKACTLIPPQFYGTLAAMWIFQWNQTLNCLKIDHLILY